MLPIKLTLSEDFFKEEIRCGYKIPVEMKKVWAVELDLLSEFQSVCKRHNIRWFADGGTLLGAARHKGMIPWDDDIDVVLFRDDYEKLCKIGRKEFSSPYFFQTEWTDSGSLRGHAQLRNSKTTAILSGERYGKFSKINQGIFIDIFPIDAIPDDRDQFNRQNERLDSLRNQFLLMHEMIFMKWKQTRRNKIALYWNYWLLQLRGLPFFRRYIGYDAIYKEYELELSRYNTMNTKYVGDLCLRPWKEYRLLKRELFSDVTFLPFEMFKIPVPIGYKDILGSYFGDWHKYVMGTSIHGKVFFDPERSYIEYLSKQ